MAEFEYQPVDQLSFYPPTSFNDLCRLRQHLRKAEPLGRKIEKIGKQIVRMETPEPEFHAENREAIANYVRDISKVIQAMEERVELPETTLQPEKWGKKVYSISEQPKTLKKWAAKLTKYARAVADAALILQRYTERAEERADGSDLDDEMDRDPEGPRTPPTKSDRGAQPNYGETMSLDYKWMIGFLQKIEDMRDRVLGERGYYNVDGPIHQTDDAFRSEENIKSFQDLMSYIRSSLSYWKTNMKDFNHELKTMLELRMELTKQMKFAELRKWQARNEKREPRTFEQACQEFHNHLGQQRLIRTRMSCTDMIYYKCPRCADDVVRVREHDAARDSRLKNEKNWPKIGASIKCPHPQCGHEGVHIVEVKEGCGSALAAFPLDMAPGGVPGEETHEGEGTGWKIMCDSYPNFPTNVGVKKVKRTPKDYCECAGIPRFPHDRSIKNDVEKGRDPLNFFEKSLNATDVATDVEQHFIPIVPNEEASALGSKRLIVPNASQTGKIIWEPEKGEAFVAKFTAETDVFEQAKTGDYLMLSAPMQTRFSKKKRDPHRLDKPIGFTGNFKDHPLDGSYFIVKVLSPDTVLISIDSLFNRQFPAKSSHGSSVPIRLYQAAFSGGTMEMKQVPVNPNDEDSPLTDEELFVVTEPDGTWHAMDPSIFTQSVRWALMKIDINDTVDAAQRKWPRWKVREAKESLGMLYDRLPSNVETLEELDGVIEALESEFEWVEGRETDVRKSRKDRFKDQEAANAYKQMARDMRALEDRIAKQEAMPIADMSDPGLSEMYNELGDIFTSEMDKLAEFFSNVTDKAAIADAFREAEAAQYERMERIRRGELGPSDDLFVRALHGLSHSHEASNLAKMAEERFTRLSKFESITGKKATILVTDPETGEQHQLETTDPDAIELRKAYNTFGQYLKKYDPAELDEKGKSAKIPMDQFRAAKDVLVEFGYYTEEQWQQLMEKGWAHSDDVEPKKMIVSSPEENLPRFAILIPDIDRKVKRALEKMGKNPFVTNVSIVKLGQSDKFGGPPVDDFRLRDHTEAVAMYFTLLVDSEIATSHGKHLLQMVQKDLKNWKIDSEYVTDERGPAYASAPAIWEQDLDAFDTRKQAVSKQREETFNYLLRSAMSDLTGIRLFPVSSDQAFRNMEDRLSKLNTLYRAVMGTELDHKEQKATYEANAQSIASMQEERKAKVKQYRALGGKMKHLKGNLQALPDKAREKAVEIRELEKEVEILTQRNRDIRESMGLTDDLLNALGHGKRYIVGEHQKGHFRSEVSLIPGIYQRILHNQKTVLEIITKLRDKVYGYGNWGDTITPREVADDTTATMVMDILNHRKRERQRMISELQAALLTLMEKQMDIDPVLVKKVEDLKKSTSIPQFREYRMQVIENSIADLLDEIHMMEGLVGSEDAKPEELRSSYEQVHGQWVTYQKRAEEMKAEMERFASMHEEVQKYLQWEEDVAASQQSVVEAEKPLNINLEEKETEKSEAEQRLAELEAKNIHVRRFADYYGRAKAQQHQLKLKRAEVVDALRSKEIDQAQAEEAMSIIDMELEGVDETHYLDALEAQYNIYKKLDVDEDIEMSNAEFRRHLSAGPIGAARAIAKNYSAMLQMANNNQERFQEMLDQYNRELRRLMAKPNVRELFYVERTGPEFNPDVYEQQQLDIQNKNQEAQQFLSQGKEREAQQAELQVEALKEQFEFSQQALQLWRSAKPFVMNYLYLNEPAYKEVASSYFQENERYQQVEHALGQARKRFFDLRGSQDPSDQAEAARLEAQQQQLKWQLENAFPIRRLIKGKSDLKPGFVRKKIDELEASLDLVSEYYDLKSDLDSIPVETENKEEKAAREAKLDQARRDRDEAKEAGLAFDSKEVQAYQSMLKNYDQMNKFAKQFRNQLLYLSSRLVETIGEEAGFDLDEEMNPYQDFMDEQMSSEEALKYQNMVDEADREIERLQAQPDRSEEAAALWAQIDSLQKRRVSLRSLVKLKPTTSLDVEYEDEDEFEDEEDPSATLRVIMDLGKQIEQVSEKLEDYYPEVQVSKQVRRREHALEQLEAIKKKARAQALRTTVGLMDAPRPEDVKAKEQEVRDAKAAVDAALARRDEAEAEREKYADNPERPKYERAQKAWTQANGAYIQAKKELDIKKAEYRVASANVIGAGERAAPKNPIQDIEELNEQIKKLQARQREVLSDPDRANELPELRQEIDAVQEKMRQVSRVGNDPLREAYGNLFRLYRERDSFMGKDPLTEEELEELTAQRDQLHLQQSQAARDGNRALESQIQDEIDKVDAKREKILTLSKYDGNLALDECRASSNAVRRLRADRKVLRAAYNDALAIGPSADPEKIKLEIGDIDVQIQKHREILNQWDRETMMKTMSGDLYDELSETMQDLEEIRYLTNKKNSLQTQLFGLSGLKAPDRARFYLREIAWLLCNDNDRDLYKPTPEHVGLGTGAENVLVPLTQRYEEFRKDFSPDKKTCNHGKAPGGSVSYNPKFGMERKKLRGKMKLADDDKLTEDERDDPSGKWLGIYSPKVPNTHLTQTLYRSKSMAEQIVRENEQTGDNRPVPLIPFYRRDEFPADDLYEIGREKPKSAAKDDVSKKERRWVVGSDGTVYTEEEAEAAGFDLDEKWILSSVYQCPYKGIIQVSGRRCPQCRQNTIDRNGVKCANPDCGFVAEAADMPNVACYTCGRQLFGENEDWPNRSESMAYQSKFEAGAPIRFMTAAEMQNIQDRAIIRELYGALMQTLHDFVSPIKAFVPPERIAGQNRATRGHTPRYNSRQARAELNSAIRTITDRGGSIWVERPMYREDGSPVLDDEGNQMMERVIARSLQSAYDRAKWFDSNFTLDDPNENHMEKMQSGKRQARVGSDRKARGGEGRKRFTRRKRGAGLADSLIQPGDKVCISEIQDRALVGLTGTVTAVDPVTYEAIVEFDKNDRVVDRRGRFYFHELELLEREVVQEVSHLIESIFSEL